MIKHVYDVNTTLGVIDKAVEQFKLNAVYGLFSGGHDSLTSVHIASKHPKFAGVIHIDTGTGLPETRAFVDETCKAHGWELHIGKGAWSYEQLIIKYGFPGPASHEFMYRYLKERPLEQVRQKLARKHATEYVVTRGKNKGQVKKKPGKVGFVTGIRQEESVQRMGVVEPYHQQKSTYWIAPIFDWAKMQCTQYISDNELKRSLVSDCLHMSGECFCGSYARPDELREIEFWFPQHAKKIAGWEKLVNVAVEIGFAEVPSKHECWGWKDQTPRGQMELLPMCFYCRGHEPEPQLE